MSTRIHYSVPLDVKLRRFQSEINDILEDSAPTRDSTIAAKLIYRQVQSLIDTYDKISNTSDRTARQVELEGRVLLERSMTTVGIVSRSNTNRNPFELYEPFREICQSFFEREIHLILTSEWDYVPFTYPMTLDDLPRFIVIGLPASESDNVLVFPTAGHELGHTIWKEGLYRDSFSARVQLEAENIIASDPSYLSEAFPAIAPHAFENDLFGVNLKQSFTYTSVGAALHQLEEIFCDIIGLLLFGRSYLYAFEYMVAPGDRVRRTATYPSTRERVEILNTNATSLGFHIPAFEDRFAPKPKASGNAKSKVELVDSLRRGFQSELMHLALHCMKTAGRRHPTEKNTILATEYFRSGMPTHGDVEMGDTISAAWDLFVDPTYKPLDGSPDSKIAHLSDLVFKSMEVQEFKGWRI